jgi:uncharacterized protein (TIGR00369 family)
LQNARQADSLPFTLQARPDTRETNGTVGPTRARVVEWDDPAALAASGREMAGLDFLRAMVDGDLPAPPVARLLGMRIVAVEWGVATFTLTPCESLYNPIGMVHGGVTATLLDSAMGCAVHSELPAGVGYTTLELKANYLRPIVAETGTVRCRARVVHRGGTVATAEARVWREADEELLAHATTTCLILRPGGGDGNDRQAMASSRSERDGSDAAARAS